MIPASININPFLNIIRPPENIFKFSNYFVLRLYFNNETVCSLSFQNRSKLDEQTICAELGVKALTVENGYRFINPVACWKFFEVSKVA